MTDTDKLARAVAKYMAGSSCQKAAEEFQIPYARIYQHLKFRNLMRPSPTMFEKKNLDPSPEEIAEATARIRESWTVEEYSRRWVGRPGIKRVSCSVRKWRGVA